MVKFPKTEKVEFRMRQDLADRLPEGQAERERFLNDAAEYKLNSAEWRSRGGKSTSPEKQAAVRENGRKGGRPKKPISANGMWLDVIKDGKRRTLRLVGGGGDQYALVVEYPDGQTINAQYQPDEAGHVPDIKFWAEKNGFDAAE